MADPVKTTPTASSRRARSVIASVAGGAGAEREQRFAATFTIGSDPDCDLRIPHPSVAPRHAQVLFDGIVWWVRHVADSGKTRIDGTSIQMVPLSGEAKVELGEGGPVVQLTVTEAEAPEPAPPAPAARAPATGPELSQAEIMAKYFRPGGNEPAGRQTMMFRAAFQTAQKKSSRRYHVVIAAILVVLVSAGAVILVQRQKLQKLQSSAERFFYAMKTLELRTGTLEDLVVATTDPEKAAALADSREKLRNMEREYDSFVRELGAYARVSERQRYVLRVARRFGECEVNIPKNFVTEVERYIERWRDGERLANALRRARANGFGPVITRAFSEGNLPPQFVYLALQESNFNDRAIGPPTRYGVAKGMWQFIALTAHKYGLKVGPLYEEAVYDPEDERFDWPRATRAAVKYLRELTTTEAQASGLLAMASYNWGEHNVRGIIAQLPEDPQDRNFWRLLRDRRVPTETFDYVLSIFSAAVICENPAAFGFDVQCPIPPQPPIDEAGRDRVR